MLVWHAITQFLSYMASFLCVTDMPNHHHIANPVMNTYREQSHQHHFHPINPIRNSANKQDEEAHAKLSDQFRLRTIKRVYVSLTTGFPRPDAGRIEIPIGRDPNNRLRMVATSNYGKGNARFAASRYKVMEGFAGGGCALVEWRLETGRTHQIRAHAKFLGIPLLGDEVYGGTKSMAMSILRAKASAKFHENISEMLTKLNRPCLHALSLGFTHPQTGEFLEFSRPPPDDFSQVLDLLRSITENEDE